VERDRKGSGVPASGGLRHVRVAVVGAGFAGIGMAIRLRRAGIDDFVVLERAPDLGGTWRDNTYPGCACDVPSHLYSYSFAPNPFWSRSFSPQPEIHRYLRECAERFGIRPHLRYDHDVLEARWSEDDQCWNLDTTAGPWRADVVVGGFGPLSEPLVPDLPGLSTFEGTVFHSARWDHDHDLTGERVAVVGTGASAVQFVPEIQPRVRSLDVYQRTAPWVLPRHDRAIGPVEHRIYATHPLLQRLVRAGIYWGRESFATGFARGGRAMAIPSHLAKRHLERQVPDPALRARLTPDYTIGCKRILLSDDYLPALCQPNVTVVTEGIREVRPRSIVTEDGSERPVSTIILGTGFHVTDVPAARRIIGNGGRRLSEAWQAGMEAYKGTTVAGFPNLFLLVGPNTGLGHTSIVFMIEAQTAYVLDGIRTMDTMGLTSVDVRPEAQRQFNEDLQEKLAPTVWSSGGCRSYYLDAHGKNTTLWPGFTWPYRRLTRHFDPHAYLLTRRARDGEADRAREGNREGDRDQRRGASGGTALQHYTLDSPVFFM